MPMLSLMIKPVSGACNMRCRYCFYADVMSHRETQVRPPMSLETLELLVRRALRYAGDDGVSFSFQGGEPTLAGLEFYQKLIEFQKMYNTRAIPVSNAIQTNGYHLSDEMIALFARERFLVGVSLDGDALAHDRMRPDAAGQPTFRRIQENIRRLQAAGVDVNILCVVNEYVAQRPAEVFEALAPYGYLQFIACLDGLDGDRQDHSLTEERYLHFLKRSFDLYCARFKRGSFVSVRNFDNYIGILMGIPPENCAISGRCGNYFLLESDGGVYPCDFYVLDEWKMGSIQDLPFNRLARSETGAEFRARSLPVPAECQACRWYALCRNGCMRERDPETGRNRWCRCFREFFDYAHPRMLEIAEIRLRAERG